MAGTVAENPPSNRVLEALEETGVEGGGFVEAEVGVRAGGGGVRVLRGGLDLLEEPVGDAKVIVVVRIERRAEPMQEAHRAKGGRSRSCGAGLPQGGLEGAEKDVEDGARGPGPVVEEGPLRRLGRERTNWRTGTWGKTWSTRWAAVSAMRRAPQEGQHPRPRHENATRNSYPQREQGARANPWAKIPHLR